MVASEYLYEYFGRSNIVILVVQVANKRVSKSIHVDFTIRTTRSPVLSNNEPMPRSDNVEYLGSNVDS